MDQEDDWLRVLHPVELATATSRQVDAVRRTYVVSRGLQRLVGAHYLSTDPLDVRIDRRCDDCGSTSHGRPRWVDAEKLDYSISHSGGWVILAAVSSGGIGVDLEFRPDLCPPEGLDDFAATVLTAAELAFFERLQGPQRGDYLCRMWVRKEATLKASGQGLRVEPSAVDVRSTRVLMPRDDASAPSRTDPLPRTSSGRAFYLRDLPAEEGYRAALASTSPLKGVLAHVVRYDVSTSERDAALRGLTSEVLTGL